MSDNEDRQVQQEASFSYTIEQTAKEPRVKIKVSDCRNEADGLRLNEAAQKVVVDLLQRQGKFAQEANI
jgi:hypothetical protein